MKGYLRYADIVLVAFVVATAAMLIVPLPTPLLDVLLVLNISFSILLLLVGLYVPSSSVLYGFPTVLLLSTLFRLGLNVASSRLILSQGDAGRVIESFGTFLIGGEIVVGVIVFCIITIVNFIVISKGASRVSEVAARFSLDALPGKQAAIDNDSRAGLLSADEAKRKRDNLNREGQLYGSMDGAMNFVQGDAIAGFFIIVANILGGIYLGVANGMAIQEAVQTYTLLTVGDGLVTQIPSLLTSICAGIVVTRVASSESSTLSGDLRMQFFSQPVTLVVTGAILLLFAVLPGIPSFPFILVAFFAIVGGIFLLRQRRSDPGVGLSSNEFRRPAGLPANVQSTVDSEFDDGAITLSLDANVLYRTYKSNPTKFLAVWQAFRADFLADVGVLLPEIMVISDDLAAPSSYSVLASGVEMISGKVLPDSLLLEVSSSQAAVLGLEVLAEEDHPISGHRVFWALHTPNLRRMLEAGSLRGFDFFEFITLRIAYFALRHPEEFLSTTDIHSLLRQVEKKHPGLIAEGFGREFVSVPKLAEILQELVRQGMSIRDFRGVVESIASFCSMNGLSLDSEQTFDMPTMISSIRAAKRRQLVRRYAGVARVLRVVALSSGVEQILQDAELERSTLPLAVEGDVFEALNAGLQRVLKPAFELGVAPVAIACRAELREKVLSFARGYARTVYVVSFEEMDSSIPIQQVGTWSLAYR
jgi:type III secretion protein V